MYRNQRKIIDNRIIKVIYDVIYENLDKQVSAATVTNIKEINILNLQQ